MRAVLNCTHFETLPCARPRNTTIPKGMLWGSGFFFCSYGYSFEEKGRTRYSIFFRYSRLPHWSAHAWINTWTAQHIDLHLTLGLNLTLTFRGQHIFSCVSMKNDGVRIIAFEFLPSKLFALGLRMFYVDNFTVISLKRKGHHLICPLEALRVG